MKLVLDKHVWRWSFHWLLLVWSIWQSHRARTRTHACYSNRIHIFTFLSNEFIKNSTCFTQKKSLNINPAAVWWFKTIAFDWFSFEYSDSASLLSLLLLSMLMYIHIRTIKYPIDADVYGLIFTQMITNDSLPVCIDLSVVTYPRIHTHIHLNTFTCRRFFFRIGWW